MIKGWIIKKVGEDIYLQYNGRDYDWSSFPYIFTYVSVANDVAKSYPNSEVKRADIFITP